jgi:hypothetical protein
MKELNFEFNVASDEDFENLIADIGFENNLVAIFSYFTKKNLNRFRQPHAMPLVHLKAGS